MVKNISVLCLMCFASNCLSMATSAIGGIAGQVAGSVMSGKEDSGFLDSVKNFFSSQGVDVKKITVYVSDETNQGAPVKIYLVVVFDGSDEEQKAESSAAKSYLDISTAKNCDEVMKYLKDKFPDVTVSVCWDVIAKKGVHLLSLKKDGKLLLDCKHLNAIKAYIFVGNYKNCDERRPQMAVVPAGENIGIFLDKDTFYIDENKIINKMVNEQLGIEINKSKEKSKTKGS